MALKNRNVSAMVVLVSLVAGAVSCRSTQEEAIEEVTVVHMPVLSGCKDEVTESLRAIPSSSPFVGHYVPFDETFRSHAELAGFVVLESSEYSRETLVQLARGVTTTCRRLISDAFAKTDEQEAKRLFDFLRRVSAGTVSYFDDGVGGRVDSQQVYIVNEPDALRVYFGLEE
jgi:hypothetical protein